MSLLFMTFLSKEECVFHVLRKEASSDEKLVMTYTTFFYSQCRVTQPAFRVLYTLDEHVNDIKDVFI